MLSEHLHAVLASVENLVPGSDGNFRPQPSWKEVGPRENAWKRVLEVGSSHLWLFGCLKVSFILCYVLP